MPEASEVRTSVDALRDRVVGRRVLVFDLDDRSRYATRKPVGWDGFERWIAPGTCTVDRIGCRGKFTWWEFVDPTDDRWSMACTYGMSGRWAFGAEYPVHAVACLALDRDPSSVWFVDPRHFGTLAFSPGTDAVRAKLAGLGPDLLDTVGLSDGTEPGPVLAMCRSDRTLAELLLDQRIVAGIGNYIKCEALYRAGVDPWKRGFEASAAELAAVVREARAVALEAYAGRGATIATYVDPDGRRGGFRFRVYGRAADDNGYAIRADEGPDGRTTWWCPTIQR